MEHYFQRLFTQTKTTTTPGDIPAGIPEGQSPESPAIVQGEIPGKSPFLEIKETIKDIPVETHDKGHSKGKEESIGIPPEKTIHTDMIADKETDIPGQTEVESHKTDQPETKTPFSLSEDNKKENTETEQQPTVHDGIMIINKAGENMEHKQGEMIIKKTPYQDEPLIKDEFIINRVLPHITQKKGRPFIKQPDETGDSQNLEEFSQNKGEIPSSPCKNYYLEDVLTWVNEETEKSLDMKSGKQKKEQGKEPLLPPLPDTPFIPPHKKSIHSPETGEDISISIGSIHLTLEAAEGEAKPPQHITRPPPSPQPKQDFLWWQRNYLNPH